MKTHLAEDKGGVEMDETHSSEIASNALSSSSVDSTDSGVGALHSSSILHINQKSAVNTLWSNGVAAAEIYHDWSLGLGFKFICLLK